ncbi:DUF3156 family protein [Pseudomonas kitaguniensis]|uniref:DUF3156 family protein n=1 Tax=Pseudomonas kitaguniensis TaxID=2607908 RepID=UPI003D038CC5
MLSKLSDFFRSHRLPSGYRPGVTLEHLRRNLSQPTFQLSGPLRAQFRFTAEGPELEVLERAESQLLMHLVMTEFRFHTPAPQWSEGCYEVHHTGAVSRSGLKCRRRSGARDFSDALTNELATNQTLRSALMPLDFKKLRIEYARGGWDVVLEHMGGSEVVNRMPAFRRYIPLTSEQLRLLQQAVTSLDQLLKTL